MLKRFSAKQYKNVEAENLELARVTLLVGPNNGGKSNLLEALRFYSDVFCYEGTGSAFLAAVEARGYGEVLRRSVKPPGDVELRWESQVGPHRVATNEVAFRVGTSEKFPAGFFVTRDTGRVIDPASDRLYAREIDASTPNLYKVSLRKSAGGPESTFAAKRDSSDLAVSPNQPPDKDKDVDLVVDDYPAMGNWRWFRDEVERQRFYRGSLLEPRAIASSAKRNLTILELDETGSELVNVLNNLERKHNDFLIPYENRLREALPGLDRLRIDDVSDQYKSLKLRIDGEWFRLGELSEGTLKLLVLTLLLFTPEKASLLAIDEPELNLHPAWLRVVGRWMLTSTGADQVLASTHSPDLLDALTEGFRRGEVTLIVCDAKTGFRNVRPADLDAFFKDGWELGDLYRVGEPQLGGWPW